MEQSSSGRGSYTPHPARSGTLICALVHPHLHSRIPQKQRETTILPNQHLRSGVEERGIGAESQTERSPTETVWFGRGLDGEQCKTPTQRAEGHIDQLCVCVLSGSDSEA
jgi:hypothetical protein